MKEIKLTQGKVALVDDADFDWLNQWKWTASKDCRTWYAIRKESRKLNNGKQKTIVMHRLILALSDPFIKGDHIDFNGLNNQRDNLRVVTDEQSVHHRRAYKKSSSKYKGVVFNAKAVNKKWIVKINKGGKCIFVGGFVSEIEAAKAYNKKVLKLNGEFAYLNKVA